MTSAVPAKGKQRRADERPQYSAKRIEALQQRQPASGAARRTDDGDDCIGRDLEEGLSSRQQQQRAQHHRERQDGLRQRQRQASSRHHRQPDDNGPHITVADDDPGDRQREQQIAGVEGKLDQQRITIVQMQRQLELGHQETDRGGQEPADEEHADG